MYDAPTPWRLFELRNSIIQEGAASPADAFLTENSPAMVLLDNAGRLAPLDADILAQVGESYRPEHGRWVGVAARSTVFAYNKTKLTEDKLPGSIMDLADPRWKGRWAAAPAGADFQAIVSAMLELEGRGRDQGMAQGDEIECHGLPGQWRGHEGRQCR